MIIKDAATGVNPLTSQSKHDKTLCRVRNLSHDRSRLTRCFSVEVPFHWTLKINKTRNTYSRYNTWTGSLHFKPVSNLWNGFLNAGCTVFTFMPFSLLQAKPVFTLICINSDTARTIFTLFLFPLPQSSKRQNKQNYAIKALLSFSDFPFKDLKTLFEAAPSLIYLYIKWSNSS